MNKKVGKTEDAGYRFGICRTLPHPADKTWDFLFSEDDLDIWLVKLDAPLEEKKNTRQRMVSKESYGF